MNRDGYLRGIKLFNEANFFEAHEVLEDVWRESLEPERKFLQGLIQLAVAFHHRSQGNLVGARSLLKRAARNLVGHPEPLGGIQPQPLLEALDSWQRCLDEGLPPPPLPQLVVDPDIARGE